MRWNVKGSYQSLTFAEQMPFRLPAPERDCYRTIGVRHTKSSCNRNVCLHTTTAVVHKQTFLCPHERVPTAENPPRKYSPGQTKLMSFFPQQVFSGRAQYGAHIPPIRSFRATNERKRSSHSVFSTSSCQYSRRYPILTYVEVFQRGFVR